MKIKFIEPLEVSDGIYNAKIVDIDEVPSKSKCLVKLQPYDEDSIYEDLFLWIGEECSTKSVTYEFFQTLGIASAEISVDELRNKFLNTSIGIEIHDNEAKDGRIFHNIVSFFDSDQIEDDGEDEAFDEDFDNEEDEEEDTDAEENADSDGDNFENEDILEGNPMKSVEKSSRRNRNNRRNRRR